MKNEYKVNKKEIMSWAKDFYLVGAASIIRFILWCFVGVSGLFLLGLYSVIGADWLDWYMASLFLAISIYSLFISRYVVYSKRYKLLSTTYGVDEWIRTTEFTDDEIILTDHNNTSRIRYESIKKIIEKNNVVMIFMNNNMALRIYKDAFSEGSWEECKDKINSKIK